MTHLTKLAICVLTFGMMGTLPAAADPIQITEGSLIGRFSVDIELRAPAHSFSLSAFGDAVNGVFSPFRCLPCLPGDQMSLRAIWIGGDFRGQATIDGTTYRFPMGDGGAGGSVEFSGSWIAPEFVGETTASVTNPFMFTGRFVYPDEGIQPRPREELFGHGLATVTVRWVEGAGFWNLAEASYVFSSDPIEPIPEPASMLLIGTGLAIMGRSLRCNRKRRSPQAPA